jgi:hypothetical protein
MICDPSISSLANDTTFKPDLVASAAASGVTPSMSITEWNLGVVLVAFASHKLDNSFREQTTHESPVCSNMNRTVSGPSVS